MMRWCESCKEWVPSSEVKWAVRDGAVESRQAYHARCGHDMAYPQYRTPFSPYEAIADPSTVSPRP